MQCEQANDHNFWNLASSYLHFLNKDFDIASSQLDKVKSNDVLYKTMVRNLTAYIDICRQPKITSDEERRLFAEYRAQATLAVLSAHRMKKQVHPRRKKHQRARCA